MLLVFLSLAIYNSASLFYFATFNVEPGTHLKFITSITVIEVFLCATSEFLLIQVFRTIVKEAKKSALLEDSRNVDYHSSIFSS
jgi:hypothetical protein